MPTDVSQVQAGTGWAAIQAATVPAGTSLRPVLLSTERNRRATTRSNAASVESPRGQVRIPRGTGGTSVIGVGGGWGVQPTA